MLCFIKWKSDFYISVKKEIGLKQSCMAWYLRNACYRLFSYSVSYFYYIISNTNARISNSGNPKSKPVTWHNYLYSKYLVGDMLNLRCVWTFKIVYRWKDMRSPYLMLPVSMVRSWCFCGMVIIIPML